MKNTSKNLKENSSLFSNSVSSLCTPSSPPTAFLIYKHI